MSRSLFCVSTTRKYQGISSNSLVLRGHAPRHMESGLTLSPDTRARAGRGGPALRASTVRFKFRLGDQFRPSDMDPEPVEPNAEKPAPGRRGAGRTGRGERRPGLALEKLRLDDADAGIDEGRRHAGGRAREAALARHREVAGPVDADRARSPPPEAGRPWLPGSNARASRAMFERGPSIQKASVLHRRNGSGPRAASALDAAALIEELGPLVRDDDLWPAARGKMRLDLVGKPMDIDDRASRPRSRRAGRGNDR